VVVVVVVVVFVPTLAARPALPLRLSTARRPLEVLDSITRRDGLEVRRVDVRLLGALILFLVLGVRREDLTGVNVVLDFTFFDEDFLRGRLFFGDVTIPLRLKLEEDRRFVLTGLSVCLVDLLLAGVVFFFLDVKRELGLEREEVFLTVLDFVKLLTDFCA